MFARLCGFVDSDLSVVASFCWSLHGVFFSTIRNNYSVYKWLYHISYGQPVLHTFNLNKRCPKGINIDLQFCF